MSEPEGQVVYVATANPGVTADPATDDAYYQCTCGWSAWGRAGMREHFWAGHYGNGRFAEDWAPVEESLEEYRRAVEREVVDLLVMNLEAQGDALRRERQPLKGAQYAVAADLIRGHRGEWLG